MIASLRRSPWWYAPLAVGAAGVAVFLPWQVGFGLAIVLAGAVLVLARPVWGVYALVLSVPVQREVSIAGRATATQAVMVFVLLAWWAWTATRGRKIRLPGFALALAAYLVVMGVSLLVATSVAVGLAEMARWTVVLLAYVIIVNTIQTRAQVIGLAVCFFAGAVAEALLGLWQAATRQVPPSFFVGQGGDPEALAPRAFGTIGAPNSFAGYLNLTLALAIAVSLYLLASRVRRFWILDFGFWKSPTRITGRHSETPSPGLDVSDLAGDSKIQNPKSKIGLAFALAVTGLTGLMLAALVVSYSRGGFLGLAFGVVGMAVALGRRAVPALIGLALGTALLGALAVSGALPASIHDRLVSTIDQLEIYDVSAVRPTPDTFNQIERLAHWQVAASMYLYDPWLGVGIGNYNLTFPRFALPLWPVSEGQAHNYYLQALAETGLLGLAAYLVVLGVALTTGWRALRRALAARRGWEGALLIGALGVVLTIMGHSVFEDLHVLNLGIHWAAVISLFYVVKV